MSEAAKGHLAMLLFSALVAGSFALGSLVANLVEPLALTAARFALSAGFVAGAIALTGGMRRESLRAPWRYLLLGAVFASYFVLMFEGLKTAPPVSTSAVFTLTPLMAAGFGWLLLRQGMTARMALALAVGAAGALWVIFRADLSALLAFEIGRGEAIYFVGCVAHALYTPLARRLNRGERPFEFALGVMISGARVVGALGAQDRISERGQALSGRRVHRRLAQMGGIAGAEAAPLAALMAERDPVQGGGVDLALRLEALHDPKRFLEKRHAQLNRGALERIRTETQRLRKAAPNATKASLSTGEMAALAYPDRIGLRRKGDAARFQLSGGKGAIMEDSDALAGARLIVATDLDGNPREARIRQAIQITESAVRDLFADQIAWVDLCAWSKRDRRVITRQQEKLGAIALDDRVWKDAPPDALANAMLDGVRELGLSPAMTDAARRFVARVSLAREAGQDLPDMSEGALLSTLDVWLLPHLIGVRSSEDWKRFDLLQALRGMLDWTQMQSLDQFVPGKFTTPLGREIPIDYSGEHPEISLRLQEMFGQKTHPCVGKTPLRVTLLSPAQRPVQTTMDLPGFWAGSYADVRKDMRAAYPKHPWPEDPTEADPTLRAKRRQGR